MKLLTALLLLITVSFSATAQFDDEPENDSPLMKAVRTNNLATVKKLVAGGAEINEDSDHGWKDVPVDVAVKSGFQPIALYLLENGATSRRYFYSAVEKGNLAFVKQLVGYGYSDDEAVLAAAESNNGELVEYLIAQGLPVNFTQKRRTGLFRKEYVSPMDAALSTRNTRSIMALVKGGAPIEEAFEFACLSADIPLGTQLLSLKKDLDKLHLIAVKENNLALARKAILSGADPKYVNEDGRNALHIAVSNGAEQTMNYAIKECGIPLTTKTTQGENCLMLAAESRNFGLFSGLLQQNVFGIEETDEYNETVLFYAIGSGNSEMVDLLLARNANVNHQNASGVTPTMKSLSSDSYKMYESLIEKEVNYSLKDNKGVDVLGYYFSLSYPSLSQIEFLVNKGCNAKGLDENGANMAYHAVRTNNLPLLNKMKAWNVSVDPMDGNGKWASSYSMRSDIVQFIITNGADPNRLSSSGDSYLLAAFHDKDIQLFAFLLRTGASANAGSDRNHPFIFSLLDDNYAEYLKLLIEYGADVNVKDTWGDNVLEKAQEKDNTTSVIAILRAAGAKTRKEWAEFEVQRIKEMQSISGLVEAKNLAAVSNLIKKYPDIVLTKDQINTLIRPAIQQENLEFIQLLFNQGLQSTATVNFEQQTLAHLAAMDGKLNLLKLFVNKGADPLATDAFDKQPIDYAKDKEIKSYLKEQAKKQRK